MCGPIDSDRFEFCPLGGRQASGKLALHEALGGPNRELTVDRVRCRPLVLPVVRARPSAVAGQRYWYRWRGEAVPSSERDVRFDRWADRGPWEAVAAASPKWSESIELDISELGRLSPF